VRKRVGIGQKIARAAVMPTSAQGHNAREASDLSPAERLYLADPRSLNDARGYGTLQKAHDALLTLYRSFGFDAELGRRLWHEISQNGIGDIEAEGSVNNAHWGHDIRSS
jgi:hypothetical protein